ncbi:hypothetical protein PIB30_004564 [Stylosanthes scabra]|uniref:Uncharacterized protein n=1 Tax=Stylosanthes scabra TaxID=79078 RepID=A0ABU6Y1V9_9FABA|nr:hypothetical protein [Stylosanthes scabra]
MNSVVVEYDGHRRREGGYNTNGGDYSDGRIEAKVIVAHINPGVVTRMVEAGGIERYGLGVVRALEFHDNCVM